MLDSCVTPRDKRRNSCCLLALSVLFCLTPAKPRCDIGTRAPVEHASGPLAAALTGMSIEVGQKLSGWVAAHRRTIVNSDAQLDLCDVVSEDIGPHSCLSTALCDGEALTGVLTVYRDSAKPFTPADAQSFEMIAPHLARMFGPLRHTRPALRAEGRPDLRVVGGRAARF